MKKERCDVAFMDRYGPNVQPVAVLSLGSHSQMLLT